MTLVKSGSLEDVPRFKAETGHQKSNASRKTLAETRFESENPVHILQMQFADFEKIEQFASSEI